MHPINEDENGYQLNNENLSYGCISLGKNINLNRYHPKNNFDLFQFSLKNCFSGSHKSTNILNPVMCSDWQHCSIITVCPIFSSWSLNKGHFEKDIFYSIYYLGDEVKEENKTFTIQEHLQRYFEGESLETVKEKLESDIESEKINLFPDEFICNGKTVN